MIGRGLWEHLRALSVACASNCGISRGLRNEASSEECSVVGFVCFAGFCEFVAGADEDAAGGSSKDACQSAGASNCEGGCGQVRATRSAATEIRKVQAGERAGSDSLRRPP